MMSLKMPTLTRVSRRIRRVFESDREREKALADLQNFLRSCTSVIHVGANVGQERDEYERLGLKVLWIEPIPFVFEQLSENIASYEQQRAIKALVTNREGEPCQLNVACNNGASSSILDLKHHKDIWPHITFDETLNLTSTTLPALLKEHGLEPESFDALIMDTQGSELMVLEGAESILENFKFVRTEVADFESYEGCCQLSEIDAFMNRHGFTPFSRHEFAKWKGGGSYYDVSYRR